MSSIDKYSELTGDLLIDKLKQFVKEVNVDFEFLSDRTDCYAKADSDS